MEDAEGTSLSPILKDLLLPQAYEERRYFRRLHVTIWSIWMTILAVLLGALMANLTAVEALRSTPWIASVLSISVFVSFPALGIYFILRFHITYWWHARFIAENAQRIKAAAYGRTELSDRLEEAFRHVVVAHYGDETPPLRKGRGHWVYVGTIALFALLNAVIFWFASSPLPNP